MRQGYPSANLVHKHSEQDDSLVIESLQHLALAATTDKQTIAQLVEANAKLTDSIRKLTEKLAQALQTIATLTGLSDSSSTKTKSKSQQKFDLQMDPVGYCWSHGYKVKLGHCSATCTRKNEVIKMLQQELILWVAVL